MESGRSGSRPTGKVKLFACSRCGRWSKADEDEEKERIVAGLCVVCYNDAGYEGLLRALHRS